MQVDFRMNKTVILPVKIDNRSLNIVRSYKLLGLWFDDDLKWKTNAEYIIKKGSKRLYLLKILKSHKAPKEALMRFYIAVVRSAVEYGAQVWNGNLTKEQVKDIERIYSEKSDENNHQVIGYLKTCKTLSTNYTMASATK